MFTLGIIALPAGSSVAEFPRIRLPTEVGRFRPSEICHGPSSFTFPGSPLGGGQARSDEPVYRVQERGNPAVDPAAFRSAGQKISPAARPPDDSTPPELSAPGPGRHPGGPGHPPSVWGRRGTDCLPPRTWGPAGDRPPGDPESRQD